MLKYSTRRICFEFCNKCFNCKWFCCSTQIQEELTPTDIETIKQYTGELKKLQDADEDLSCLPTLVLEDILPDIPIVKASDAYDDFMSI